jgi:uncharacterized membrane protein
MQQLSHKSDQTSTGDLDVAMKLASLVLAVTAVSLMLAGLLWFWAAQGLSSWPGSSVTPLWDFSSIRNLHGPTLAMSIGLVMLCLLPGLRILIALGIYLRRRNFVEVMIAAIVLLELLLSMTVIVR